MSAAVVTELQRRLANVVKAGTVEECDFAKARVRVRFGEIITAWLPMCGQRAGGVKVWSPLTVGEQVIVLSPSGDLSTGLVMPGTYSDANPSPGDAGDQFRIEFPDGAKLFYDTEGGTLNFESPATVKIKAPSIELEADGIIFKGPVTQTGGDITSDSDVIASTVSLKTHKHTGVESGSNDSGPPKVTP